MFAIEYTESASDDLEHLRESEQRVIMDTIDRQLSVDPLTPTRHRKSLRPNDLSEWELRIGRFRAFYDVDITNNIVTVKAIGWKEHNRLFIRGKEFTL